MPRGRIPIPNRITHDVDQATTNIFVTRRDGSEHCVKICLYLWPAYAINNFHCYVGRVHKNNPNKFYARIMVNGKMEYLHRWMMANHLTKDFPEVDHIFSEDTLDCRLTALRPANRKMQQNNRTNNRK